MTNFKLMGVTALSLALAFATPALARGGGGGHGGGMEADTVAAASMVAVWAAAFTAAALPDMAVTVTGTVAAWPCRGVGGWQRSRYGYGGYYGDGYYADNGYYDGNYGNGQPYVAASGPPANSAYCAQQYRSYDPASGTYLGYDGLRHPCG